MIRSPNISKYPFSNYPISTKHKCILLTNFLVRNGIVGHIWTPKFLLGKSYDLDSRKKREIKKKFLLLNIEKVSNKKARKKSKTKI